MQDGFWLSRRVAVALWLCLQGCTYITSNELEDKRATLDEDGDRSPRKVDCDDEDPSRAPQFDEVPYDGIDNDCGQDGDVVDLDGDGYPGITAEDYAALDPVEPYPADLVGRPLDCADDPAVHPEAADVFPGNSAEVPYDGVDSDCDRGNDFDVDGDGYMPGTSSADFDAYVATWGYEDQVPLWAANGKNAPELGDCDDFDPTTHPDPGQADAWYDGVDLDCDGTNDFDQDGDGYMPAVVDGGDTEPLYQAFIDHYGLPDDRPGDVSLPDGRVLTAFSDCLDWANPAIVPTGGADPVDPADVYPQPGLDAWYDGVDTNCWADDDFDQDLDGFFPTTVVDDDGNSHVTQDLYDAYVTNWGYSAYEAGWATGGLSAPGPGDCVDDDPLAYPAALEYVGDFVDQDCDGSADAAAFTFAGWRWTNPSAPRVVRLGESYAFVVTATGANLAGTVLDEVGFAMSIKLEDAATGAIPTNAQFKPPHPEQPIGSHIDLTRVPVDEDLTGDTIPDPAAWFATTVTVDLNGQTYLRGWHLYENSDTGILGLYGTTVSNYYDATYVDGSVEVAVNSAAEPYLVACAPDLLHGIQSVGGQPSEPEVEDETVGAGDLCFLNTEPYAIATDEVVELTRCNDVKCQDFQLVRSGTTLVVSPGALTGELWTSATTHGPLQMLTGTSNVVRDTTSGVDTLVLPGKTILSIDAMYLGATLFLAAVVDDPVDGPIVELAYGVPPTLDTELVLPFYDPDLPDLVPSDVGLQVDDDRVFVVVTGRDPVQTPEQDAVGWMFLGTP